MASRRVTWIVGLCAVLVVVATVGGTVLQSRGETTTVPGAVSKPRPGPPPLELELVGRRDPESAALARAQTLLDAHGKAAQAAAIFRRYHSIEAQLGLAFATWTGPGSLRGVERIAATHPDSPAALLNLGWAQFQAGKEAEAAASWQKTARSFPDSPYAVDAEYELHSAHVAPGLPPIVVDLRAVPAAARGDLRAGLRFWDNLKQVVSARRDLDAAAKLAPHSPEALVAAAVARFSPADPSAPFPVLGPLSGEFPNASIVRLHLGVLLLWKREIAKGKEQLRLAVSEQPGSVYAQQAQQLLQALAKDGS